MKKAHIESFFAALQAANPDPRTELEFSSEFELLVAVLLSAQATDAGVNKATRRLFAVANTPQAMLELGEAGLHQYLATINLYRSKTRHLLQTCRMLLDDFGGEIPRTREALQSLPGVGRKTANVVLNVAFGQPTMAVDTHIFRVSNRTGLAPGATPLAVEQALLRRVPAAYAVHAHHWLILLGRYVCQARTPRCGECGVSAWCGYKSKTPLKTPAAGKARTSTVRTSTSRTSTPAPARLQTSAQASAQALAAAALVAPAADLTSDQVPGRTVQDAGRGKARSRPAGRAQRPKEQP